MIKISYKYSPETFVSLRQYASLCWQSFLAGLTARYARVIRDDSVRACFVVGCGHTGTTMVAAKLGNLPEVHVIGYETNAFFPKVGSYASATLFYHWKRMAKAAGKTVLLEKTPKHIQRISAIKKILPEAKFVMMLRNPLDNIASLYKRTGDFKYALARWLADAEPAIKFSDAEFVHIVKYEDITANPKIVMRGICKFLDITYSRVVLAAGTTAFGAHKDLIDPRIAAQRVEGTSQPIQKQRTSWRDVLSEGQAAMIIKQTTDVSSCLGYSLPRIKPPKNK